MKKRKKGAAGLFAAMLAGVLLILGMPGGAAEAAASLTLIAEDSAELIAPGQISPIVERKSSNVTVTVNSGTASYGVLTKEEAGYQVSDMGGAVNKRHESQTDKNGKAFRSSGVYDENVAYQRAIKLEKYTKERWDTSSVTLDYDDVGNVNGRRIGIKVTFTDFHVNQGGPEAKLRKKIVDTVGLGNRLTYDWNTGHYPEILAYAESLGFEDPNRTASALANGLSTGERLDQYGDTITIDRPVGDTPYVVYTNCFYNGFFWKNITQADVTFEVYYKDSKETCSLKDSCMTVNSLNGPSDTEPSGGEGIFSNAVTKAYARTGTNIKAASIPGRNGEAIGGFAGGSNQFTDAIGAGDFTLNSVTLVSPEAAPSYTLATLNRDGGRYVGGQYWWTMVFGPFSVSVPQDPVKTGVDASGAEVTGFQDVEIGDTLTYKIRQQVSALGLTSSTPYASMQLADVLPEEVAYQSAYVQANVNGTITRLPDTAVTISRSGRTVTADFAPAYLKYDASRQDAASGMLYQGEVYELVVSAKVQSQPGVEAFQNDGYSRIGGKQLDADPVPAEWAKAVLTVEKEVSRYEWKVGDQVEYCVIVANPGKNTAFHVEISDLTIPESLTLSDEIEAETEKGTADIVKTGNTWTVTADSLAAGEEIRIRFGCTAAEAANGSEVVNTAYVTADNIDPVQDAAEAFINSGKFEIVEEVSKNKGPVSECQVGDVLDYTITISNQKENTIARNVIVEDLTLPEGMQLVGTPAAEGIPETIREPIPGEDNVPGETQEKQVTYSLEPGENGVILRISDLPDDLPVTIRYQCKATGPVNGSVVKTTAKVTADNVAGEEDSAQVYVNSARLAVSEEVSRTEWQVGDILDYTITVSNQEENTIARNVLIRDLSLPEGLVPVGPPAVEGAPETIRDPILQEKTVTAGAAVREQGIEASLSDLPPGMPVVIRFSCEAAEGLNGKTIRTKAGAKADNAAEAEDGTEVFINTPKLQIEKTSDAQVYHMGSTGIYQLWIRQTHPGTVARKVVITDHLDTENAKIRQESLVLEKNGQELEPESVLFTRDGRGFVIETGTEMTNQDELTATYEVVFENPAEDTPVVNLAAVYGENTSGDEIVYETMLEHTAAEEPEESGDAPAAKTGDPLPGWLLAVFTGALAAAAAFLIRRFLTFLFR